jgi:hypothetical protein
MSSVDTMDIPEMTTETSVTASAESGSEPAAKRRKPSCEQFCDRIRNATGWFSTMADGEWKNVTTEKSRRTLFVLQTPAGGDQFCCVGKVFKARLSKEELLQPLPYDTSEEHTELSVSLGLRPGGDNKHWSNYDQDIKEVAEAFTALRDKAIQDAFVPLLASKPDKMAGITDGRLKKGFGKTKKDIAAALEVMWGGTGMNGEGDIVRFRRKCYNTSIGDLSSAHGNWLSVADERGDPINYVDEHESIRTGDTVLVWYRVLAQACAGNFHVSLEPRQVMRLGRGSDGMAKGSAGLAASLRQAIERGDEI